MSYLHWEIFCDWRYAMTHPECLLHEQGPGSALPGLFILWSYVAVCVAAVVKVTVRWIKSRRDNS